MSLRVLIADDAGFIREILRTLCETQGDLVVAEATNGVEAIELAKKTKPNLIFMDLVMPEKNGVEATQEIKKINPEIHIIACSTLDQEQYVSDALNAGCSHYIRKPFNKQDVTSILQKYRTPQKETSHV